jgi:hypothetical protein
MSGYTRNGIAYNSEDEANLAAAIPGAYLNSLDAGYVAEAILDSEWLAEHDRQEREKGRIQSRARVDAALTGSRSAMAIRSTSATSTRSTRARRASSRLR